MLQITFAREFLKEVRMKNDQVKYLVTNARNGMCQGHRAELFAVRAAKASAALAVSPILWLLSQLTHTMHAKVMNMHIRLASRVTCSCADRATAACNVTEHQLLSRHEQLTADFTELHMGW